MARLPSGSGGMTDVCRLTVHGFRPMFPRFQDAVLALLQTEPNSDATPCAVRSTGVSVEVAESSGRWHKRGRTQYVDSEILHQPSAEESGALGGAIALKSQIGGGLGEFSRQKAQTFSLR